MIIVITVADTVFRISTQRSDFFKNDMWFGATIAYVPNMKILVKFDLVYFINIYEVCHITKQLYLSEFLFRKMHQFFLSHMELISKFKLYFKYFTVNQITVLVW